MESNQQILSRRWYATAAPPLVERVWTKETRIRLMGTITIKTRDQDWNSDDNIY